MTSDKAAGAEALPVRSANSSWWWTLLKTILGWLQGIAIPVAGGVAGWVGFDLMNPQHFTVTDFRTGEPVTPAILQTAIAALGAYLGNLLNKTDWMAALKAVLQGVGIVPQPGPLTADQQVDLYYRTVWLSQAMPAGWKPLPVVQTPVPTPAPSPPAA